MNAFSCIDSKIALDAIGKSAWELDLVITVHFMPGIFDLDLRQFCAEYRANVSVILATGYSERKTQDISPSKKLNIVLNKPFGFNGLKRIINVAIAER